MGAIIPPEVRNLMAKNREDADAGIDPPPESALLSGAYKRSKLTAADLSAATGISVSAVRIALNGIRYREGQPRPVSPPDQTLAKLASVLGLGADELKAIGRETASELITEAKATPPKDLDTPAAIAGRNVLASQVLGLFSTAELQAELDRRGSTEGE